MQALWVALVLSITDGDTFRAQINLFPGQTIETNIRLADVNAPELRGQCEEEKQKAKEAKAILVNVLRGKEIYLSDIKHDKYGNRYVARVYTSSGINVNYELLKYSVFIPYEEKPRWCE